MRWWEQAVGANTINRWIYGFRSEKSVIDLFFIGAVCIKVLQDSNLLEKCGRFGIVFASSALEI